MMIEIPDDLARGLENIAAAQRKSVAQLAVERLRASIELSPSPQALLQRLRALPHPSPADVDEIEAVIVSGGLPLAEPEPFEK